ncbi:AraC family transcriptional regulator [Verrucomicrobia bacterium S94]|nr:AraC family transcriptional regulator [Verrucomicrobia bacterium S94]
MQSQPDYLKLDYLYGGEILYQPGEHLENRVLTDFEVVYILSGQATYIANGQAHPAPPGSLIFGLPGTEETYEWDPVEITRHAFFHFGASHLPSDWPPPQNWPRIHHTPPDLSVSLFRHIMKHIYEHRNWPAEPPGHRDCMLVESLINTCFESGKAEWESFQPDRPEPVRRALKWMRQQIDENPLAQFTLAEIARSANCSSKHLCRLFSRSVGYPPVYTGTLMRMQLALVLLTRSNLSVKEIALRCGFENPLYFSRRFTRIFGRAPSAVRKDVEQGTPPPPDPLPVDITPRIHW